MSEMVRCSMFVPGCSGSCLPFILACLLATVNGCYGMCVFGTNNTFELVLRNDTIIAEMNKTLLDVLQLATQNLLSVSSFNLTATLQFSYNVSPNNALSFVAYGKLWPITWINETQGVASNISLPKMITTEFVNPVHSALQNVATKYSFSIGLFRPKQKQFNFTGLQEGFPYFTPNLTTCQAGNVIVIRCEVSLTYHTTFTLPNTSEYASLAAMLEKTLDPYFRSSSVYAYDFVRVNVLNVSSWSSANAKYPCADVEFYFFNESRTGREIKLFLDKVPSMTYVDSAGKNSSAFISRTEVVSETNVSSLVVSTTMVTTISATESTTFSTTFDPPSSPLADTSTNNTLTTTTRNPTTTAVVNPSAPSTPHVSVTITSNVEITTISEESLLSSTPTTQSIPTLLNATKISLLPAIANSSVSSSTGSITKITSTITGTNGTSTLSFASPGISTSLLSTGSSNMKNSDTESPKILSATDTYRTSTFSGFPNANVSTTKLFLFKNSTSLLKDNTSSSSDREIKTVKGNSTFDPDPWFRADVPVVTKIYNDRVLVDRKMGTMAPLLQKADFYYIALPAAIGMIGAAVGCVICLQTEWLPKYSKI